MAKLYRWETKEMPRMLLTGLTSLFWLCPVFIMSTYSACLKQYNLFSFPMSCDPNVLSNPGQPLNTISKYIAALQWSKENALPETVLIIN